MLSQRWNKPQAWKGFSCFSIDMTRIGNDVRLNIFKQFMLEIKTPPYGQNPIFKNTWSIFVNYIIDNNHIGKCIHLCLSIYSYHTAIEYNFERSLTVQKFNINSKQTGLELSNQRMTNEPKKHMFFHIFIFFFSFLSDSIPEKSVNKLNDARMDLMSAYDGINQMHSQGKSIKSIVSKQEEQVRK